MFPPCLESHGSQFDPTFLLYSYIISSLVLLPSRVALSGLSFSAFGPFSSFFVFVCLFDFDFERLGDEYFSWWYVQHLLPYDTGNSGITITSISLYAFIL